MYTDGDGVCAHLVDFGGVPKSPVCPDVIWGQGSVPQTAMCLGLPRATWFSTLYGNLMNYLLEMTLVLLSLSTCAEMPLPDGSVRQDDPLAIIVDPAATSTGNRTFRRIQQAVDQAREGDTILVKKGTYRETVTIRKKGLTLAAFNAAQPPILDGSDPSFGRPSWQHVQGKVYRTPYTWYKPQLKTREFNQYGGGEAADRIAMQVYEDGVLLRGYVGGFVDYGTSGYGAPYTSISQLDPASSMFHPYASYKREIRIPGRFLYDEREGELYVWSADEDDPSNHVYSIPVLQNLVVLAARGVTLRNLVLANAAGYAVVVGDDADDARIEDSCFTGDMYAIYVRRADNLNVAGNFIQQRGMWERYWYYDCKETVLWTHAIALEHYPNDAQRRTEIRNNVIHGYYGAVLANGIVTIHDNILSHCLSTHVNIDENCPEIRVYRNVCHHVEDGSIGVPGQLGGNVWVFRNLFYHCGSLNKTGADQPVATDKRAYFYHNTVALSDLISHHPYDYPVFRRDVYRNNIFELEYLEPGSELYWRYAGKDPQLGWAFVPFANGPDVDYNLYWIGPTGPSRYIAYFSYAGNTAGEYLYDDFARMARETGLDPHGLQADPAFREPPLLDAGTLGTAPYDTLSVMDYGNVLQTGLPRLLEAQVQRFWNVFAPEEGSPAKDRGTRLPAGWPEVVQVRDGKPDLGAVEIGVTDTSE